VSGFVASQGEPRRECLVAACIGLTSVWLLHSLFFEVVIVLGSEQVFYNYIKLVNLLLSGTKLSEI